MIPRIFHILPVIALAAAPAPAMAQERIELDSASGWVMNYDDESCALQRMFGSEGRQVFLELRQFGPSAEMQVLVASKDVQLRGGSAQAVFEPAELEGRKVDGFSLNLSDDYRGRLFESSLMDGDGEYDAAYRQFVETAPMLTEDQRRTLLRALDPELSDRSRTSLTTNNSEYSLGRQIAAEAFQRTAEFRRLTQAREAGVQGFYVAGAFAEDIFLATGPMDDAMTAMRACVDELMQHWGIDVEAHHTLTRAPRPVDYDRLMRRFAERYPSSMVREGLSGYVRLRLDVSEEGEPTGCHIQLPISDKTFEDVACRNMMSFARFSPALDAQGQPIASYYQQTIAYRLN